MSTLAIIDLEKKNRTFQKGEMQREENPVVVVGVWCWWW